MSRCDPVQNDQWAASRGITIQTQYRDDEVRSFYIWSSDHSRKAHVGVSRINDNDVELTVFDGRKRRQRLSCDPESITSLLEEASELARSWIDEA
jgi:hypothetical protein